MAFVALGALFVLAMSFDPDMRTFRSLIWGAAGGYLLGFTVTTPSLWRSGKRRAREMAADDDAQRTIDPSLPKSEYGRTVRRSRGQGIILCAITTLCGVLALAHYFIATAMEPSLLELKFGVVAVLGGIGGISYYATRV